MSSSWTVDFAHANARLDVFLTEKTKASRAKIKKQIEAGGFLVNGESVSVHHFLKEGDVVEEGVVKMQDGKVAPTKISRPLKLAPLEIVRETKDWIVLNKPTGVIMHPDQDETDDEAGTLIDAVLLHAPEVARVGEDPSRPGIMSRLDKEVSGLVVIAKTQAAYESLKQQFAEHSITKEYLAFVHGDVQTDEGDIKFRIARSTTKARMAARAENDPGGKAAWTHYRVARRFTGATLLRLQILTGRTHQIRAHLHAFRHPVIGDPLYTLKQTKRKIVAPRLMLQSVKLEFNDPATGERERFELAADPAFNTLMESFSQN